MNCLLVGMEWFPNRAGGLNRYFFEEVHALAPLGIGGTAVVTSVKRGDSAPLTLAGMAHAGASLPHRLIGGHRIVRKLVKSNPDVINSHFALYAYPWLGLLSDRSPFVVNFQGPWASEILAESGSLRARVRAGLARHIERQVYARADRVITLSNSFQELVQKDYAINRDRIRVVPGGVNLVPYLAAPSQVEARERMGWPVARKILITVRRLAHRMGLERLIDAMLIVRKARPDSLLLIGGTGRIASELQERVELHGLQEHVRLLGFIPDEQLPLAYAAADLTVVPTVALEGFGLVTVESLASGTPVMGTRVGGTPEILEGLSPDLLFDSAEPPTLAEGIIAGLNGSVALPGAEECRAYSRRYGWDEVAPRILAVFEDAIRAKQERSA